MTETERILSQVVGGSELLERLGGRANFHDSEVIQLCLTRGGPSRLVLDVLMPDGKGWKKAQVTFQLSADVGLVDLEGFSHQNVIGGLTISEVPDRNWHPSLHGIGFTTPDHLIELEPCAGAFGRILCTIVGIEVSESITP